MLALPGVGMAREERASVAPAAKHSKGDTPLAKPAPGLRTMVSPKKAQAKLLAQSLFWNQVDFRPRWMWSCLWG